MITVVGLGPGGLDLMTAGARSAIGDAVDAATPVFFRTRHHPAVAALLAEGAAGGDAGTFDDCYERRATFGAVYDSITATLLEVAGGAGSVLYGVPGSPLVAERTVELLRTRAADAGIVLEFVPGLSFCDLAWARLGLDPIAAGVRVVDGARFAEQAAGDHGPLLVAQCWSNGVLSDVKLSIEEPAAHQRAIVLHHLGLPDEQIVEVAWEELDRTVEADHLTSLFVDRLSAPVAGELVRLTETVARLRLECPWDQEQTHQSLVRHFLEETYEAIEAIEGLGDSPSDAAADRVAHAEEELGDVLCQIVFHAVLAREEGLFDLADVARTITEKLITRHPHVFADVVAETAADVVTNWERSKRDEKGREYILDGIPAAMPSLARAATIERKLAAAGVGWPAGELVEAGDPGTALLALARSIAADGADPEGALRRALDRLVDRVGAAERAATGSGRTLAELTPPERAALLRDAPPQL